MHQLSSRRTSSTLDALSPIAKAYALGYAASTGPRLFGFLRVVIKKNISLEAKIRLLYTILKTSTDFNRFPTSCGIVAGGATVLPRLLLAILLWLTRQIPSLRTAVNINVKLHRRLTMLTTVFSALLAFKLLNADPTWARKRAQSLSSPTPPPMNLMFNAPPSNAGHAPPNQHIRPPPSSRIVFAGKTLPLTLFTLTRALDILHLRLLTRLNPNKPTYRSTKFTDPTFFILSCIPIMHAWFYSPSRLPRTYNTWITRAASIDQRLLTALRLAREHIFIYGQDNSATSPETLTLTTLASDLHLPPHWGDPSITVPVPCELVHSGTGPSCEFHALTRFVRGWAFAMRLYIPLKLLSLLRSPHRTSLATILSASLSAARSSTFLGAFIAYFYYAVCVTRTRLPSLLSALAFKTRYLTPQTIDSGLCVLAGCVACGFAVLLENEGRRMELMGFVLPRALATVLPRVYDGRRWQGCERAVFVGTVVVLVDAVRFGKGNVRGVLGRVLEGVLR